MPPRVDNTKPPATPELDRRSEIMDSLRHPHEVLTDFYDWLQSRHIWLAHYVKYDEYRDEQLTPISTNPEVLFAQFFGIDLDKIETEQRALLDYLRGK